MNLIKSKKPSKRLQSQSSLADKSRMLALNLSDLSLEEVAKVIRQLGSAQSRFNEKRNLLILEFDHQHKKVDYMKQLPQRLWNCGAVLWECSNEQLEDWIYETLLNG